MAHKKFWQMSGIVLALSFVLLACPTDGEDEDDVWSDVTSYSQLSGTWKNTRSEKKSLIEVMKEEGIDWQNMEGVAEMADVIAGISVTASEEEFVTCNTTTMKVSGSGTEKITFSGEGIDQLWEFIKAFLEQDEWSLDDKSHSGTKTYNYADYDSSESDFVAMAMDEGEINQNGTKIKTPIYSYSDSEDAGSGSSPEKTKIGERLFIKQ